MGRASEPTFLVVPAAPESVITVSQAPGCAHSFVKRDMDSEEVWGGKGLLFLSYLIGILVMDAKTISESEIKLQDRGFELKEGEIKTMRDR